MKATVIAPTNIAIIKYWGKNPTFENIHVPNKSSLSFTVQKLTTTTTVEAERGEFEIEFTLNGKKITAEMKEAKYVFKFLNNIKKFYPFLNNYKIKVVSENNFPTAAGYASSASGFAAFARALVEAVPEFEDIRNDDKKVSILARLGSGSATRSVPSKGGLVLWKRGVDPETSYLYDEKEASERSYAYTLIEPEKLQDLSIIYTKVNEGAKKIKSRAGMKSTVQTNPVYWNWIRYEEAHLLKETIDALQNNEREKLLNNIMKASNGLHSMCLYTQPSITYLNDTSKLIMHSIEEYNNDEVKAAYTFDAGPNAVIFTYKEYEKEVKDLLLNILEDEQKILSTSVGEGPRKTDNHLF